MSGGATQVYQAPFGQNVDGVRRLAFGRSKVVLVDLWKNKDVYKVDVYTLPKKLDEEVARLHLEKIGVKLTTLSAAQANYLGVAPEGPYKPETYRY